MKLFDSHAHLTDGRFGADLSDVLARASEADIDAVVTIASDPDDAEAAAGLARARAGTPALWATAGLHPHAADAWDDGSRDRLETLARAEEVVAIGETGLDFHYENAPRAAQEDAFRAQLELAAALELPVVVHSRDADREMIRIVREHAGRPVGVLHCFTGGAELLDAGLESGWFVSLSGIVTFGSYSDHEIVRAIPADRLLIETDSPYLAPEPRRGRRNEPANLPLVLDRVAELRGDDREELAALTCRNAYRFYGLRSTADAA